MHFWQLKKKAQDRIKIERNINPDTKEHNMCFETSFLLGIFSHYCAVMVCGLHHEAIFESTSSAGSW